MLLAILAAFAQPMPDQLPFRPPSIPLVAHDPYFSIWMPNEVWTSADTEHWTHTPHQIRVVATIDGQEFRLLGNPGSKTPALPQTGTSVTPTQVGATFSGMGVKVELIFLSASVATDLDMMSRPLSYVVCRSAATDGKPHQVGFTVSVNGLLAASRTDQQVASKIEALGKASVISFGTVNQPVLATKGDRTQIDWGYCYLGAQGGSVWASAEATAPAGSFTARLEFGPRKVGKAPVEQVSFLAYDDGRSIQYFGQDLKGYWRRNGTDMRSLLLGAADALPAIRRACEAFDKELTADFMAIGGPDYSLLASLAYRQCIAGSKLVADPNGQPLWFPKENSSNGCLATADVIYPMSPQALLFGPALAKALVEPILAYGGSSRWKFPFAPHDLGTYPLANGQVYGGGEQSEENQMPVEESANMLILVTAIAHMEGNAEYAGRHWPALSRWAHYLVEKGFNPENQLCTDDFLGHQAQNVNLSAKAILGIRAYAELCRMQGKTEDALAYKTTAENYAARWIRESADGGHSRLTFDKPGTWSQKYNLVWDTILGFGTFPQSVKEAEMTFYRSKLNPYGLPIDSRGTGAKLDWNIWIATLTGNPSDWESVMQGVYRYAGETPNRIGLGDWYDTATGHLNFFEARPVMGAAMIPFLYRPALWQKYAHKNPLNPAGWAPIPPAPVVVPVMVAADQEPVTWQYTTDLPAPDWFKPAYNDRKWKSGRSGFGMDGTPGARVSTVWDTPDIWIRRVVDLPYPIPDNLRLWLHHDDDVDVYLNGVLALKREGWTTGYEVFAISKAALKSLKPGQNSIAIHCHQNQGGQYIDCGLVQVSKPKP